MKAGVEEENLQPLQETWLLAGPTLRITKISNSGRPPPEDGTLGNRNNREKGCHLQSWEVAGR